MLDLCWQLVAQVVMHQAIEELCLRPHALVAKNRMQY
jgi:hypothetical protein